MSFSLNGKTRDLISFLGKFEAAGLVWKHQVPVRNVCGSNGKQAANVRAILIDATEMSGLIPVGTLKEKLATGPTRNAPTT